MTDAPARSHRAYALGFLILVYTSNFVDRSLLGVLGQPIKAELKLQDWRSACPASSWRCCSA
jgi:hypothetical protein